MKAAVFGWPIEHSLSPALHHFWLNVYKIDGLYLKMAVAPDDLKLALKQLAVDQFRGVNLTVPHKETALSLVDRLDPLAERVGAINTVVVQKDGSLFGLNTDVFGFTQNLLLNGFRFGEGPTTILGAGGAARAAIVALKMQPGRQPIRLVNRTLDRAKQVADQLGEDVIPFAWGDEAAFADSTLLVNATTIGLKGSVFPTLPLHKLSPKATVMDMVYTPPMTGLLRIAKHEGFSTVDGLGMLLHQARPAFEAFFGCDPIVTEELRQTIVGAL